MKKKLIKRIFILAGLVNIGGILLFSKFFTNDYLTQVNAQTFSNLSLVLIMIWGAAYIVVAGQISKVPALSLVFAIEKAVYVFDYVSWLQSTPYSLGAIWQHDLLTGTFYAVYGLNDLLFGVFFLVVFFQFTFRSKT